MPRCKPHPIKKERRKKKTKLSVFTPLPGTICVEPRIYQHQPHNLSPCLTNSFF